MKKITIILSLLLLGVFAIAQPRGRHDDFEKYKALKVSFMTEKLELTPQEAQQFWPIYNEFDKKRFETHQKRRELEEQVKTNYDKYSESEFKKASYEIIDQAVKESSLLKEYHEKFLRVLPAKKVVIIGQVENEFRFKMIREYRQREREGDDRK
ncbi:hypothetical protein [Gaoshiqia sediminis]|uniref:Sensor of ECF-type sigma factor n=1 Tax=Gaoshiqia sediminis TaxID=2986998 RepID=A0AA42C8K5_9BACT|nr:hypothetical protein [Gaoshiqia sediminis]MCW0482821.1 hypothetical protein [Gaoshiqia sediminis]